MNLNYDGQGKTQAEEVHGSMVAVVIALAASSAAWLAIGAVAWAAFGG